MEPEKKLEEIADSPVPSTGKIATIDTAANITYSLVVGSFLDYWSGLNLAGIATSRASATATNTVTGGPYGWLREKLFRITKTTENSSKIRQTLVDLIAFNSFHTPMYAVMVAIGSLVSEGHVNWKKVQDGAEHLAIISPVIGPTMGWYIDGFRRVFGVRTAVQGAYTRNTQDTGPEQ